MIHDIQHFIDREYRETRRELWKPLPLLNGDPFPRDVRFPANYLALAEMTGQHLQTVDVTMVDLINTTWSESDLDRIMEVYGLSSRGLVRSEYHSDDEHSKRRIIQQFIEGKAGRDWPQ